MEQGLAVLALVFLARVFQCATVAGIAGLHPERLTDADACVDQTSGNDDGYNNQLIIHTKLSFLGALMPLHRLITCQN
jgi:hypothetical protein